MQKDPKDSKVVMMPDINGEELATAVARALRSGSSKNSASKSKLPGNKPLIQNADSNSLEESEQRKQAELNSSEQISAKESAGSTETLGRVSSLSSKVEVFSSKLAEEDKKISSENDNPNIENPGNRTSENRISEKNISSEPAINQIPVSLIKANPFQTRRAFDEDYLKELSESIKQKGVLQPIILRKVEGSTAEASITEDSAESYELISGERRLRASKLAGLEEIPAILTEMSDKEVLEASIVENAQREDLNPVEEARAFKLLQTEFNLNQSKIAEVTSKKRETVANSLRLLQLCDPVLELLDEGHLSSGHGKVLASLEEKEQISFSRKVLVNSLSVRALEKLVQKRAVQESNQPSSREPSKSESIDYEKQKASLRRLEVKISELTRIEEEQIKVSVDNQGRKKLGIVFESEASFKRFVSKLKS